ncbi:glycoside hydrolase family 64 protein [Amycolatopsis pithecellobii]|uniref:Glycosyl hydrolase n=1 Tax=Amycolatopsis pithecellobii TaxID=664692 RepID=A0A6N7ZCS7_9PSEU|nr:glycoside hydrolase family 64 protein [Amycolatopsis pithecellobii]MTD59601.1 glycosyl hydrolase [Amycolatopsis pithecellobii]
MPNRRTFLHGMAVALVGAPIGAAVVAAQTSGGGARAADAALPLTVVNHTGRFGNREIFCYIVGTDLATGHQVYSGPDGGVRQVSLSDNGSGGFADLSIPLSADGDTKLAIPANMSGRVYFSLGEKLKFKVVTDGAGNAALQYPAGWVEGDPSFAVLHDFVEFTHNSAGMFCNTTMVDMFGVPLALTLTGAANQRTGGLVPGGRDAIFRGLAAIREFAPLVVDDLRVIAPGHGIESGRFPATYFDSVIGAVWDKYASAPLTVSTGSGSVTGQVSGGMFRFGGGVAPFAMPTTRDVFFCDGALAAPNDGVTGPVAAVLGAGFNRTTLLANPNQPGTDPASFYQGQVTNHYARLLHQNSADGKAYGFPFDDVAGFASYIQDTAPSSLTVELSPFQ